MKARGIYFGLSLILLLFNALGAIYGGSSMVMHPDGSGLNMPLNVLQYSPFNDFYIPGLILLAINGFFGLYVVAVLWDGQKTAPLWVQFQGVFLLLWILIQVVLIRQFNVFHTVMITTAAMLIFSGRKLQNSGYSGEGMTS